MLRSWAKIVAALVVSLTLVAAPCKNCGPKQQEQASRPGHDCCPKPKAPDEKERCGWQPADFVAEKAKDTKVALPQLAEAPVEAALPMVFAPAEHVPVSAEPSPPPIYLSTLNLRI